MSLEHGLLEQFVTMHPADAALTLSAQSIGDRAAVFSAVAPEAAAELLRHLPSLRAARTLAELPLDVVAAIVSAARRDVAASILRTTEEGRRAAVVASLPPKVRSAISDLLHYAEDTAGALMDSDVLVAHEDETVGKALVRLQREAAHALYYIYVVGADQHLVGVLSLRELMCAQTDIAIASICSRAVDSISATSTWETVLHHPAWQRVHALPVVDSRLRFVGAIRYETVRRLERQHAAASSADHGSETVSAIGELFGLGLRGLFRWGASGGTSPTTVDAPQTRTSLDGR